MYVQEYLTRRGAVFELDWERKRWMVEIKRLNVILALTYEILRITCRAGVSCEMADGIWGASVSLVSRPSGRHPTKSALLQNTRAENSHFCNKRTHRTELMQEDMLVTSCRCCFAGILSELLWQVTLAWISAESNWYGARATVLQKVCQ